MVAQIPEQVIHICLIFLQILLFSIIFYFIKKLALHFLESHLPKLKGRHQSTNRARTLNTVILNAATYFLYFVYIYVVLSLMGVPVGTLIAGAGVVGVAIGLGAKELITDVINGFFILFENQFEVNDWVSLPNHSLAGSIVKVGIRTTTIKAANGDLYYISNSEISIVNNQSRQVRTVNIDLPMNHQLPLEEFETVLKNKVRVLEEKYASLLAGPSELIGPIRSNGGLDQAFAYRIAFQVVNGEHYRLEAKLYREFFLDLQQNDLLLPNSIYNK